MEKKSKFLDLLIFTNGYFSADEEMKNKFPQISKKINISNDIWISPISNNIAEEVMTACEERGFNLDEVSRQNKQLYCYLFSITGNFFYF